MCYEVTTTEELHELVLEYQAKILSVLSELKITFQEPETHQVLGIVEKAVNELPYDTDLKIIVSEV